MNNPDLLGPHGEHLKEPNSPVSGRGLEREREDEKYVPVIIKRSDQARRHADDILQHAIDEGLEQLRRRKLSLFLSAITAGLILGFSAMAVAVVISSLKQAEPNFTVRLAVALVYPLGFIVCIMSGSQLFTEHTATAVYPVLDQKASLTRLFRLWFLVISGNLVGATISATLLVMADEVVGASAGYIEIAEHLISFSNQALFISSILAGWLMAQGAWLILATPPTISQIACIYIVTFLIGFGGLHHSIAGAVEMLTGLFISSKFSYLESFRFISIAILGNLVGGSLFVALLNYAHIRKTRDVKN